MGEPSLSLDRDNESRDVLLTWLSKLSLANNFGIVIQFLV